MKSLFKIIIVSAFLTLGMQAKALVSVFVTNNTCTTIDFNMIDIYGLQSFNGGSVAGGGGTGTYPCLVDFARFDIFSPVTYSFVLTIGSTGSGSFLYGGCLPKTSVNYTWSYTTGTGNCFSPGVGNTLNITFF